MLIQNWSYACKYKFYAGDYSSAMSLGYVAMPTTTCDLCKCNLLTKSVEAM